MPVKVSKMPGWVCREVLIRKRYKTLDGFLRAAKKAFEEAEYGYLEDELSAVVKREYLRAGELYYSVPVQVRKKLMKEEMTVEGVLREFGEISYAEKYPHFKRGYDLNFNDGIIYVYVCEKEQR